MYKRQRDEIEEEVMDLVVEGRSAFTIGDPTNEFEEQIGRVVTGSNTNWSSRSPLKKPSFMKNLACCPGTTLPP